MNDPQGTDLSAKTRAEARRISREHSDDPALALSGIRPFRISSMSELILARKVTLQGTALDVGQFSENAWGFPFLPYPSVTSESNDGTYRQVPRNVSFRYIGHPIFWVDPKLTAPTEAEQIDPVRWSIRMFYLLMGLGLINGKTLQWYDAPNSKGVSYNESDIKNYMADYPSVLDGVKITAADLLIPMDEVNAATTVALARITEMQENEKERFGSLQRSAISDANQMIADDAAWDEIVKKIVRVSYTISNLSGQNHPVSQYVDTAFQLKEEVVEYLSNIESLSLILTVPVLRDEAYTTSMYSKVISLIGSFETNVVDGQYRVSIDAVLDYLFEKGGFRADTPETTVFGQLIQTHHTEAIERLQLAVNNFGRNENGKRAYGSTTEKDVFDQVMNLTP